MSRDFDGYVIVVTGGSTGLWRAIAVEVAKGGAKAVVINYSRNVTEAEPCLRDAMTTRAPCSAIRNAIARPIPLEEPVTMATLSVRSNRDI